MTPTELARVLRAADDEAERIDAEQRAELRAWTDQSLNPLGGHRHAAAVRRRVDVGAPGAAMVGRRALLSADALAEELALASKGPRKTSTREEPQSVAVRLERRLGLVGGGR